MESDLSNSVLDMSSENVEVLEENLGKWWEELWLPGIASALFFMQFFSIAFTIYFFAEFSNFNTDAISTSLSNSNIDAISTSLSRGFLLANGLFLVIFVGVIVYLLASRKRYYIVFSLQPDSAKEPEFTLSSFIRLFSREGIIPQLKSTNYSFLPEELEVSSGNDNNKGLQLETFEINMSGKASTLINQYSHIFIIAFDKNGNSNNTFIFYSRRESTWRKILAYLEDDGCTVEVQHRQEIRR